MDLGSSFFGGAEQTVALASMLVQEKSKRKMHVGQQKALRYVH
jgi:hypothetical protein